MLLQMAEFPSFSWQSSIPLCMCVAGYIFLKSIHLFMDA